MSEKIVDKNTVELYDFYSSRMADPTKKYGSVLCVSLDNIDYVDALRANNTVTVVSEQYNIINDYTFVSERDLGDYLKNMKFDCIIMNPPYNRNLHLKILAEAIKHLTLTGEVVCLHPNFLDEKIFWDKTKSFNKYRKEFSSKLIDVTEINNIFKEIQINKCLIISHFSNKPTKTFDYDQYVNKLKISTIWKKTVKTIIDKKQCDLRTACLTNVPKLKYMLAFPGLHGTFATYKPGNISKGNWLEIVTKNYEQAVNTPPHQTNKYYHEQVISFNTDEERRNFVNSTFTYFFKYWISQVKTMNAANYLKYLPFMSDYTQPWDDARFYKFFNITEEEQKIIEETMEKYK